MDDDFSSAFVDKNIIDPILDLLKTKDIVLKTDLEMPQIKLAVKSKWFALRSNPKYDAHTAQELWMLVLEHYFELKTSYQRKRVLEIVKSITEIKTPILEAGLNQPVGSGQK